jgi:hypothetical protein
MSINTIKNKNNHTPSLQMYSPYSPIHLLDNNNELELGLDFILSHLEEPLFLRKISTFKSRQQNNQYQFLTRTREEIINSFTDSDFIDCRINAYPSLTEYKGIQRYKPNFIFIDIDRNDFESDRSFKLALSKTLKNIKDKLVDGFPTVLWSGNGYHILQPIECPTALEYITEFEEFEKPSEQFLRYAKDYLSGGKADKNNYPSFRSCLLRIPGSINSKNNSRVTIIQKWNGIRPKITIEILEDFRTYLIQKKIDQEQQDNLKRRQKLLNVRTNNNKNNYENYYEWIEKLLLQTPLEDYRKLVLWKILCPYLINVRKLSYDESTLILREWLDKCNSVRRLDFNPNQKIKDDLKRVGNFYPIGIQKLKTDNEYRKLYQLLKKEKEKW